ERPAAIRTALLHGSSRAAYATPARAKVRVWAAERARLEVRRRAWILAPMAALPSPRAGRMRAAALDARFPPPPAHPPSPAPAAAPRPGPAGSGTRHAPGAR